MDYRQRYIDRLVAAKRILSEYSQRRFIRKFYLLMATCSKESYLAHQRAIGTAVKEKVIRTRLVDSQKQIGKLLSEHLSVINQLCNGHRLTEQKTAVFDALFRQVHDSNALSPCELFLLAKIGLLTEFGFPARDRSIGLDDAKLISACIRYHEEWYFEVANSMDFDKHRNLAVKVGRLAVHLFDAPPVESPDAEFIRRLSVLYSEWGPGLFAVDSRLKLYFPWRVLD